MWPFTESKSKRAARLRSEALMHQANELAERRKAQIARARQPLEQEVSDDEQWLQSLIAPKNPDAPHRQPTHHQPTHHQPTHTHTPTPHTTHTTHTHTHHDSGGHYSGGHDSGGFSGGHH